MHFSVEEEQSNKTEMDLFLQTKMSCQIIPPEGNCIFIAANSCHLFLSVDRSIKNRNKKEQNEKFAAIESERKKNPNEDN